MTHPDGRPALVPLLIVRDAVAALAFYVDVLGAIEVARYLQPSGAVSHADLRLGDAMFSVTEEARRWNSDAPPSLGGSPVVLQLRTDGVDALAARMVASGAKLVYPTQEFCGERMARLRDPFGHLWIVAEQVESLTVEEIRARRAAFFAGLAAARPS